MSTTTTLEAIAVVDALEDGIAAAQRLLADLRAALAPTPPASPAPAGLLAADAAPAAAAAEEVRAPARAGGAAGRAEPPVEAGQVVDHLRALAAAGGHDLVAVAGELSAALAPAPWSLDEEYSGPEEDMLLVHAVLSPAEQLLLDAGRPEWAGRGDAAAPAEHVARWSRQATAAAAGCADADRVAMFAVSMALQACQTAADWAAVELPAQVDPVWRLWAAPVSSASLLALEDAPMHPYGGQVICGRAVAWHAVRGVDAAAVAAAAAVAGLLLGVDDLQD